MRRNLKNHLNNPTPQPAAETASSSSSSGSKFASSDRTRPATRRSTRAANADATVKNCKFHPNFDDRPAPARLCWLAVPWTAHRSLADTQLKNETAGPQRPQLGSRESTSFGALLLRGAP